MLFHRIKTRKGIKGYRFFSFVRNLSSKYGKQLLDTATKTELDALKAASKKVTDKAAETTSEIIGKKIADKTVKPDKNSRNVEEIKRRNIK